MRFRKGSWLVAGFAALPVAGVMGYGQSISSVSPTSGPVGTQVQINGSGFGASQGSSTVTFDTFSGSVTSWSDGQITATAPARAATGPVKVTVGGAASNSITFTVPAPQITSISPNIGGWGNPVTVNGSGFQNTQGFGYLWFTGPTATITSWSDTQIQAIVPSGISSGSVVVVAANANDSNFVSYTISSISINSLSPNNGPVGTQVTVSGSGFGATQGSSTLTFDGQPALVSNWSDGQIVATVPVTAASGGVMVTVNNINSNSNLIFTVPGPTLNSYTPSGGVSGTQVTINGSNFQPNQRNSMVTFNGTAAAVSNWSDAQIIATVPASATSGPLVVTVNGVASQTPFFEVPNPVITSVTPSVAPVNGFFTIKGSGFGLAETSTSSGELTYTGFVHLDGTNVSVLADSWSDTQIVTHYNQPYSGTDVHPLIRT